MPVQRGETCDVGEARPREDGASLWQGRNMRVSKRIAATAEAIYAAFMSADALAAWLPPAGMQAKVHAFDAQRGYRMTLRYASGGHGKTTADSDTVDVRYVELIPNERIVQAVQFESADAAFAGTMTMTWTMRDGEVSVAVENAPSGISDEDHELGIRSSLDGLAAFVTRSR